MILMIPADRHRPPSPVELAEQTDQGHCSLTAAAGAGAVGEVPVAAAVD